jgi:hypothetical protein
VAAALPAVRLPRAAYPTDSGPGFAESLADGVVTDDDVAEAGRVILREAERWTAWSPT